MPDSEDCVIDRRRAQRGGLLSGEVPIKKAELNSLYRTKSDAEHYLRAVRILAAGSEAMRDERARGSEYARGWLDCLRLLAQTIESAGGHGDS